MGVSGSKPHEIESKWFPDFETKLPSREGKRDGKWNVVYSFLTVGRRRLDAYLGRALILQYKTETSGSPRIVQTLLGRPLR
jgi:hypothetical protein